MLLRRFTTAAPRSRTAGDAETVGKVLGVVLFFVIGYVVYSWDDWGDTIALADLEAESWVSDPPKKWPTIVLANEATFREHSDLDGGSAFLIEHGDAVYGAAARHLLTDAAGVEPDIPLRKLDGVLETWEMYPAAAPSRTIRFSRLHGKPSAYGDHDAIFLVAGETPRRLPSTPLKVFKGKVQPEETVYLIAVPYSEGEVKQNVYRGTVFSVGYRGDPITFRLDTPVNAHGFSGAPVVNEKGWVVGILIAGFPFGQDDEGRDTMLIAQALRPRRGLFPD